MNDPSSSFVLLDWLVFVPKKDKGRVHHCTGNTSNAITDRNFMLRMHEYLLVEFVLQRAEI